MTTLDRLTAAASDKDWADQAHGLLGSARAVGAKCLADRVLIAQKLPGSFRSPDRTSVLSAITVEIEAANRYIRELFPEE